MKHPGQWVLIGLALVMIVANGWLTTAVLGYAAAWLWSRSGSCFSGRCSCSATGGFGGGRRARSSATDGGTRRALGAHSVTVYAEQDRLIRLGHIRITRAETKS